MYTLWSLTDGENKMYIILYSYIGGCCDAIEGFLQRTVLKRTIFYEQQGLRILFHYKEPFVQ